MFIKTIINKGDKPMENDQNISFNTSTTVYNKKRILNKTKQGKFIILGHPNDPDHYYVNKIKCKKTLDPNSELIWLIEYDVTMYRMGLIETDPLDAFIDKLQNEGICVDSESIHGYTRTPEIQGVPWHTYIQTLIEVEKQYEAGLRDGQFVLIIAAGFHKKQDI